VALPIAQIIEVSPAVVGGVQMMYAFAYALFDGVTTATLDLSLPRNALVDDYRVLVRAERVDSTLVQEVAQVRTYASNAGNELVVDFGTPRTVSGIDLPSGVNVLAVHPWLGSQFAPFPTYEKRTGATADALFAELRTERLRIIVSRPPSADELAQMRLRLPEPPSGLAISIDGAPPVWTHPEPVQPRGNVGTPDEDGWDKDSKRIVPLTAALAALTGDPLAADDAVPLQLKLTTQVPCRLSLAVHGTPLLRRIRRVRFGGETTAALAFAEEGRLDLPLPLPAPPAPRRIDELRWVAQAELPATRVQPPLGPDAAAGAGVPVLAEMLITPERAVCVRLPGGSGLAELLGVRLPLRAFGDGAEARVVLWSNQGALPLEPLPQGASEPLTLKPGDMETWVGFGFSNAVAIAAADMPWLALIVSRGEVGWSLAAAAGGQPAGDGVIRRGPPNGPWKALPAPLQGALLDARARLRLVGLAAKDTPLAPLVLQFAGRAVALDPTPKGLAGSLPLSPGVVLDAPSLSLISHVAGNLQLRDIDVISSN
jgi:hypothetical protein